MKKTFNILTLGCKVNQYESEAVEELFINRGFEKKKENADIYVINTCTVTNMSDRKSRQTISKARKENPNAVIAVMGCYSQVKPEEIKKIEEQQKAAPETRIAQKTLAWEVVKDLHGKDEADNAVLISQKLFAGDFKGLSVKDIMSGMKGVPSFDFTEEAPLIDVLVNNKIASSRREAREFINAKAVSVNGDVLTDENAMITKSMAIEGQIIIIRRGKKKYFIGKVI